MVHDHGKGEGARGFLLLFCIWGVHIEGLHRFNSLFSCRRLDYFVVSERLLKDVTDCVIRKGVFGSDHCPLVLGLSTSAENSGTGLTASEDVAKEASEEESTAGGDGNQGEGMRPPQTMVADAAEGSEAAGKDNEVAEVVRKEE